MNSQLLIRSLHAAVGAFQQPLEGEVNALTELKLLKANLYYPSSL